MSRIRQLLPLALLGIAIVSALFAPRLLDYAFGVVFLAGAVVGLLSSPDRPTGEPGGLQWNGTWRVMGVGVIGLFGGGAIAWGWITAARVTSGVVGIALLVLFSRWSRERRGEEEMGCGLLLLLFAATGWFGLFPTYFEQELWPGTPAGHTARGIGGYFLIWLAGLALVWVAVAVARWRPYVGVPGPRWIAIIAAAVAAIGLQVWLGGALYWSVAWPGE